MSVKVLNSIETRIRKSGLINLFYFLPDLIKGSFSDEDKKAQKQESGLQPIYFDIRSPLFDFDNARYLLIFLCFFRSGNNRLQVVPHWGLIRNALRLKFKRLLLQSEMLAFGKPSEEGNILIHDSLKNSSSEGIQISFQEYPQINRHQLMFPYTLHPAYYLDDTHLRLRSFRDQPRKVRILFSGNYRRESYSSPRFREYYGLLSRYEIFESCRDHLGDRFVLVSSQEELDAYLSGEYCNQLLWIDTSRFRIPKDQWLRYLGMSDFFLACPGMAMPFAHNMIEAMSVGAIPVTEYGDYYPPLAAWA